jgi:hypothetical protein
VKISGWLRLAVWQLGIRKLPIVVDRLSSDGPEWYVSIPGTDLKAEGWTYESALGTFIHNHQSELGFILKQKG